MIMPVATPANPSTNVLDPSYELQRIYRSQVRLVTAVSIISVFGVFLSLLPWHPAIAMIPVNSPTFFNFTVLMIIHILLHWLSTRIERRQRLAIIYLFAQIMLLFFMGWLLHYPLILLFMPPLIGEIMAVFEAVWLVPVAVLLAYALMTITQLLITPFVDPYVPYILAALLQGLVLTFWGFVPLIATFFLLLRARRQTGILLARLDTAHRQLANYADQIEHLTVTAERARMSRELHDTLAQGVAGLILQLEALESQLERGDNGRVAATLGQIKTRARTTLKESRQAIDDLRLMSDPSKTLLNAISDDLRQFSALTGLSCDVNIPSSLTLPTPATEHARRFVSEGLANIAKHAAASKVRLTVRQQEHDLILEIQDDGVGFDPGVVESDGHYGLLGLRERAQLVQGKFEIESARQRGTTLRFYLPIVNSVSHSG